MRSALLVMICVACGPSPTPRRPSAPAGDVHRKIMTSSPEAQRHFDLGLAHAYGFNYDAAKLEFEAALAADPQCSMCEWGIAYISGWNINERTKRWAGALEAADKALTLAKDPIERALAEALHARYEPYFHEIPRGADDPDYPPPDYTSTGLEDHKYITAMHELLTAHPDDDDVAILFAEAAMLTVRLGEPYWPTGVAYTFDDAGHQTTRPRRPDPMIVEAQTVLERVLARSPDHIGAIHFYIHLLEESPHLSNALPYADKLARLAPKAGHLIHMASHLYLRVGRYADAEDANRHAIAADDEMIKHLPATATYVKFAMHPKHFLWTTVIWQGERAEAKKLADELAPHFQHMAMDNPQPLGLDAMVVGFTAVRFSDWDTALALDDTATLPVAALVTHYARGLALVAKDKLDEARAEIEFLATTTMEGSPMGYRPRLIKVARIAHEQVSAAIFLANQQPDKAVEALQNAVIQEDHLDNPLEPPMWIFSSRERLGALFLKLGRTKEAADMFRSDLVRYPENGWSLFGLATALDALHDPEAPAIKKRFDKAWARSDFKLTPELL